MVGLISILWLLGGSAKILALAFAFAYLTHPLVLWFENRGIPRKFSVIFVFVLALWATALVLTTAIPFLVTEIQAFVIALPVFVQQISLKLRELALAWHIPINFTTEQILTYFQLHLADFFKSLSTGVWTSAQTLISSSIAGILWILNLFLFPVFYFYVINDYEHITEQINSFIPPSMRKRTRHLSKSAEEILAGYIRGQFLVCVVQAGVYSLGLTLLDIRFGALLGLLGGLLTIVPYVGFSIVVLSSLVMALANDAGLATYIGLLTLYLLAQALEGYVLTPRLVGHRVGLGPLGTLLALIAGANLGGLFGMMLAIPLAGILKVIIKDAWEAYRQSGVYVGTS